MWQAVRLVSAGACSAACCSCVGHRDSAPQDGSDDSDSDSDSSDDEDDTAALLRELEKIKQERAEEKARQEKERAETQQSQREDDIALGNPLLNLENAMKGSAAAQAASAGGGGGSLEFGVKRRWDEDVIFKNQAQGNEQSGKRGFVNDLTRESFVSCSAMRAAPPPPSG